MHLAPYCRQVGPQLLLQLLQLHRRQWLRVGCLLLTHLAILLLLRPLNQQMHLAPYCRQVGQQALLQLHHPLPLLALLHPDQQVSPQYLQAQHYQQVNLQLLQRLSPPHSCLPLLQLVPHPQHRRLHPQILQCLLRIDPQYFPVQWSQLVSRQLHPHLHLPPFYLLVVLQVLPQRHPPRYQQ